MVAGATTVNVDVDAGVAGKEASMANNRAMADMGTSAISSPECEMEVRAGAAK